MRTAQVIGMVFTPMWTQGGRRCFLEVTSDATLLRLVDATSVVREQIVTADVAALLAALWKDEETQRLSHHRALACHKPAASRKRGYSSRDGAVQYCTDALSPRT